MSKKAGGALPSGVIPCLTGNMVFGLVRLGYLDDPRLRRALDWLTTWQRFDDGDSEPPREGTCARYEMCWESHTCHMGVVKALKGLAEIPPGRRSPAVRRTIAEGTEFLLKHHVHKRSHDLTKVSKPSWKKLNFPLMWQTDVLEILGIFARLGKDEEGAGYGEDSRDRGAAVATDRAAPSPLRQRPDSPLLDPRAGEALDLVAGKRGAQGRWKLDNTQNGRFVVDIETKGQPSRWVTLKALQVLRAAGTAGHQPARG